MSSYLFHREVFLPASMSTPVFEGRLRYSAHARNEAQSDRYGNIRLPEVFTAANAQLIEVEAAFDGEDMCIVKQLWRQRLDDERDIVLAVMPNGTVRTVWVNLRSDAHRTLNRARYVQRYAKTAKYVKSAGNKNEN